MFSQERQHKLSCRQKSRSPQIGTEKVKVTRGAGSAPFRHRQMDGSNKWIDTALRKLTFDDLRDWAGETILNRGKGYVKRVEQLSRSQDSHLVAWVIGNERYATSVHVDEAGDFDDFCTCPYSWGPCKHAVAVILAAAERVKNKQPIAPLNEDSDLAHALFGDPEEDG